MRDPIGFALPESVEFRDVVVATYLYRCDGQVDIHRAARALAEMQSTGTWVSLDRETPVIRERHAGRVIAIWEVPDHEVPTPEDHGLRAWVLQVAYPAHNIGDQIPLLLATVYGECASSGTVKLLDVHLPESFVRAFAGPRFGLEGIRELVGAAGRPLLVAIIKPAIGLTPTESAQVFYEAALGGADAVKDDELLVSHPWSTFTDRVREHGLAAQRAFEATGHRTLYFVNVTDRPDRLVANARRAVEAGASGLLVDHVTVGIVGPRDARRGPVHQRADPGPPGVRRRHLLGAVVGRQLPPHPRQAAAPGRGRRVHLSQPVRQPPGDPDEAPQDRPGDDRPALRDPPNRPGCRGRRPCRHGPHSCWATSGSITRWLPAERCTDTRWASPPGRAPSARRSMPRRPAGRWPMLRPSTRSWRPRWNCGRRCGRPPLDRRRARRARSRGAADGGARQGGVRNGDQAADPRGGDPRHEGGRDPVPGGSRPGCGRRPHDHGAHRRRRGGRLGRHRDLRADAAGREDAGRPGRAGTVGGRVPRRGWRPAGGPGAAGGRPARRHDDLRRLDGDEHRGEHHAGPPDRRAQAPRLHDDVGRRAPLRRDEGHHDDVPDRRGWPQHGHATGAEQRRGGRRGHGHGSRARGHRGAAPDRLHDVRGDDPLRPAGVEALRGSRLRRHGQPRRRQRRPLDGGADRRRLHRGHARHHDPRDRRRAARRRPRAPDPTA